MDEKPLSADDICKEIVGLEEQLESAKERLASYPSSLEQNASFSDTHKPPPKQKRSYSTSTTIQNDTSAINGYTTSLTSDEYPRYGRQLIMPEIGLPGQLALKNASVLIIGAGGLGCPAAAYLAGAGVGKMGLVDGDVVEVGNLHRQILHSVATVGRGKVESAVGFLEGLNPKVQYVSHPTHLTAATAFPTIEPYDLILDCTDNPPSRYLISDTCVLAGKPLISASALKTEGQLLMLNNPPKSSTKKGGHCYRCVFPRPPPAEAVQTCGEGGILGPVVGVMGALMATEAIKLLTSRSGSPSTGAGGGRNGENGGPEKPSMLLYSAYSTPQFRTVRLAGKRANCAACSTTASVTREGVENGMVDHEAFCGVASPVDILGDEDRVSAKEFSAILNTPAEAGKWPVVVDVREKVQFELCHLPGSINIPLYEIERDPQTLARRVDETLDAQRARKREGAPVYFICRYGNDSQVAVRRVLDSRVVTEGKGGRVRREGIGGRSVKEGEAEGGMVVRDVRGGLKAWRGKVDGAFPVY